MPLLGPTLEGRNAIFQRLKPVCVALSQAALSSTTSQSDNNAVTVRLEQLKRALDTITDEYEALDAKLADYVFFPLSQVLKASQTLSIRCLELSLDCIAILVAQGWRAQIQPQLAAQVAILCTLMAERKPRGFNFVDSTDELQCAALLSLQSVFAAIAGSRESKELLISEANFPQLGQTISVILDDIRDVESIKVQLAATNALKQLVDNVADREICASFLPGIVSSLTKVLKPSTKQRRNHEVLVRCLEILSSLLRTTLGDDEQPETGLPKSVKSGQSRPSIIDVTWKEHAATQLKTALEAIMQLKTHHRDDVREALAKTCLALLEHCRATLASSVMLILETLITIITTGDDDISIRLRLETLARSDQSIVGILQSILYDNTQSLTTAMYSSDEPAKLRKLSHIKATHALLVDSNAATTTMVERMLVGSLRDSVVITISGSGLNNEQALSNDALIRSLDLTVHDGKFTNSMEFSQPLVRCRGQEEVMSAIEGLVQSISTASSSSGSSMREFIRSLRQSRGDAQIASFWLLLVTAQSTIRRKDAVSQFLEFDGDDHTADYNDCMEEVFSFALDVLTDHRIEIPDTRLQALALRALAIRARLTGVDFRYELVDALYPVLHTLATPDETLQLDSITTLNTFTTACGYDSVKDLVVENVDYLTNAVALKLNSFDASPQAPQVLLMMVKLAGPSLLPYLDDTVESIFAALDDFHGYSLLVELLFTVLGVVAEEGAKAPLLAIDDAQVRRKVHSIIEETWRPTSMEALASLLTEHKVEPALALDNTQDDAESHPTRPWKSFEDHGQGGEDDLGAATDEEVSTQDHQVDHTDAPPPAPRTYNLLFKITEMTQHFLPSASSTLRASLLTLIRTTVPAIAHHENMFLPLINTLWPEIVSRLDDAEPAHVKAAALEIISVLCEHAGGFMRTRIEALWSALVDMYREIAKDLVSGNGTNSTLGYGKQTSQSSTDTETSSKPVARIQLSLVNDHGDTSSRLLWDALIKTLTMIAENVDLPVETFDELLELLQPVLRQDIVRTVLGSKNADALWLANIRSGDTGIHMFPAIPDSTVWNFAPVSG